MLGVAYYRQDVGTGVQENGLQFRLSILSYHLCMLKFKQGFEWVVDLLVVKVVECGRRSLIPKLLTIISLVAIQPFSYLQSANSDLQ